MRILIMALTVTALVASSQAAHALPGTFCQAAGTASANVYHSYGGTGNVSTTYWLNAVCPYIGSFSNPPPSASVNVTIGASGGSWGVQCLVAAYSDHKTGPNWWSATKYMCWTAGGCTSSGIAGAYNTNTLSWTNPLGTTALSGAWNLQVECWLPPVGGDALVTAYN